MGFLGLTVFQPFSNQQFCEARNNKSLRNVRFHQCYVLFCIMYPLSWLPLITAAGRYSHIFACYSHIFTYYAGITPLYTAHLQLIPLKRFDSILGTYYRDSLRAKIFKTLITSLLEDIWV